MNDSFKKSADWLSLTDKPIDLKHFIKIIIKMPCSFLYFHVNMFYIVLLIDIDIIEG